MRAHGREDEVLEVRPLRRRGPQVVPGAREEGQVRAQVQDQIRLLQQGQQVGQGPWMGSACEDGYCKKTYTDCSSNSDCDGSKSKCGPKGYCVGK